MATDASTLAGPTKASATRAMALKLARYSLKAPSRISPRPMGDSGSGPVRALPPVGGGRGPGPPPVAQPGSPHPADPGGWAPQPGSCGGAPHGGVPGGGGGGGPQPAGGG